MIICIVHLLCAKKYLWIKRKRLRRIFLLIVLPLLFLQTFAPYFLYISGAVVFLYIAILFSLVKKDQVLYRHRNSLLKGVPALRLVSMAIPIWIVVFLVYLILLFRFLFGT